MWTVWSYSLWYAVYGVLYLLHVWCLQESYKQALPAGPDEHQLQYCYSFRFSQRPQGGARQAAEKYEQNVKLVGCFSTVEQFWSYYCYMKRPGDLPSPCDIHLFKVGISPIWEVCTYVGTYMDVYGSFACTCSHCGLHVRVHKYIRRCNYEHQALTAAVPPLICCSFTCMVFSIGQCGTMTEHPNSCTHLSALVSSFVYLRMMPTKMGGSGWFAWRKG